MVSKVVVEEAVAAILKGDRSYCDCRRSPFDGHDVNPPCSTVLRITEQVQLTLEIAAAHLEKESVTPVLMLSEKPQWGIFGKSSPENSEPIIPPRFSSRESAQAYVKAHFPSPQFLQVRGRTATGWSAQV